MHIDKIAKSTMEPEPQIDARFRVIYEDEHLICVDKSGNCPVHEGGRYKNNCLTNLLECYLGYRVYPVYRLDRETSGIVVFAKNSAEIKNIRITDKEYFAICDGKIETEIVVEEPIGERKGEHIAWRKCVDRLGSYAKTKVIPVSCGADASLVMVILFTGRQHQIRVHMQYVGHHILGDKIYGESDVHFRNYLDGKAGSLKFSRQALHLARVCVNGILAESPMPDDMLQIARRLCIGGLPAD